MGWSDPQAREQLRELVAKVLEELDVRGAAALEQACAEHPELAEALRQRIARLRGLGLVESGGIAKDARLGAAGAAGDEPIPERIGDFRLLRRLGGGGMGVVYLAEQESLKRRVALKLVRPELLFFPSSRERFRREVEVVAKLAHPGIVPVYEVDADADLPWFSMEWIDGASLDAVIHQLHGRDPSKLTGADLHQALASASTDPGSVVSPKPHITGECAEKVRQTIQDRYAVACVRIVREAAIALAHAHERGVVHRDLKPSNVMLTREGRVRIVDFGLASTEGTTKITRTNSQLGSLPYTSPEQLAHGIAAVDARSDVYALGCVLFELLALQPAFHDDEPESTRRRILEHVFAPLRSLNPSVDRDVETVCLTAMERDPARRYATAGDFARDLQRVLDFEPILARRASAVLRLRRYAQRHPAIAVGAVLGALLVTGAPTIWAVQEHRYGRQLKDSNDALANSNDELAKSNAALEQSNQALATTNVELTDAKKTIEAQLEAEKAARAAAARSATRARESIVEFLGKVGDDLLRNVPGAADLRRELLLRATEQFESLLADAADDAVTRLLMANAFRLLALRHSELGDLPRAGAAFERGLQLTEGFTPDDPLWSEAERKRADLLADRAMTWIEREIERPRVTADSEAAIAVYRRLLERPELAPSVRCALGNALSVYGQSLVLQGEGERAVAAFEEGVRQLEQAVAREERLEQAVPNLLAARNNYGAVLERLDRLEEAEEVYRDLLDDLRAELERMPHHVFKRFLFAGASGNLGNTLTRLERQDEAVGPLRDAIAAYEGLVRDFPQLPVYRRELGRNQLDLVEALITLDPADPEIDALLEPARNGLEPIAANATDVDLLARYALAKVLLIPGEGALASGAIEPGLARLERAAALAEAIAERDAYTWDPRGLASRIDRAVANAPADAVDLAVRVEHAQRAVDAMLESVRTTPRAQRSTELRDELLAAFDLLVTLEREDTSVGERVDAAARELATLLPDDPHVARRVTARSARAGAGATNGR